MAKVGRPKGSDTRTPQIEQRIIDGLSEGIPLAVLCREKGMPHVSTVFRWAQEDEELSQSIARAREVGHDMIAHGTRQTARGKGDSTGDTHRDKLIVDTDLKLLAKWNPKRYGDRIDVTSGGEKLQREAGETEKFSRLAALMAEKRAQGLLPDHSED